MRWCRGWLSPILLPLIVLGSGCGSTGSVSLTGNIRDPVVRLEEQSLGTFVSAELDLFLELGAYAAGPARIDGAAFSLVEGRTQAQIGPALEMSSARALPMDIGKGESVTLHFATGTATTPIGQGLRADLCTGSLVIRGEVAYTLDGEQVLDARSAALTPSGC